MQNSASKTKNCFSDHKVDSSNHSTLIIALYFDTRAPANLLSIDGQAGDSDGNLLPPLRRVEEAEGGLRGNANTTGMRKPELLGHHYLV